LSVDCHRRAHLPAYGFAGVDPSTGRKLKGFEFVEDGKETRWCVAGEGRQHDVFIGSAASVDKYPMTNIPGTNVAATIAPFTTSDNYATHDSRWGRGGWKAASTIADRDAIPAQRLEDGAVVYVVATRTPYVWIGGSWIEFITGDPATASALTNEVSARQAADASLGQRITDEAAARSAAVSTLTAGAATLTSDAAAEVGARQAADTALGQRITDEATARSSAVSALTSNVATETTARSAADADIQANLDLTAVSTATAILNLQVAFIERFGYR